ncbi:MAG: putative amidohydrolase [Oceanospirillaceae bacterium]|jgi:predicted amidohydrolase
MSNLSVMVLQNPASLVGPLQRFTWLADTLVKTDLSEIDLILLPELFLCGYNIGTKVTLWCESAQGLYAKKIAALCKLYRIAIHYGYAQTDQAKLYNASNCFSKDGKKLATHQKLVLPPGHEKTYFSAGKQHTTFVLNGLKIGTLICYDVEFPENCRHLAKMGVDVILVPTALAAQWGVVAHKVIPTRAFENGVYICYANQAGSEEDLTYLGASCIIGPDGHELQRATEHAEVLKADLHKEQVIKAQTRLPYLQDLQQISI